MFSEWFFNQTGKASLGVSGQRVLKFTLNRNNLLDAPELVYILFPPITPTNTLINLKSKRPSLDWLGRLIAPMIHNIKD